MHGFWPSCNALTCSAHRCSKASSLTLCVHTLRGGSFLHKLSGPCSVCDYRRVACNITADPPHCSDQSKEITAFRFFSSVDISKVLHGKTFPVFSSTHMNSFWHLRWTNTLTMTFCNPYFISETHDLALLTPLNHPYHQTLHKVSCQSSHFVFRFFRIGAASPASSPSSSSSTPHPGVPHGRVFKLDQILEDWITENTAGVLGLASRKWSASLVEVHCNQRGITGITALLSNLQGGERGSCKCWSDKTSGT